MSKAMTPAEVADHLNAVTHYPLDAYNVQTLVRTGYKISPKTARAVCKHLGYKMPMTGHALSLDTKGNEIKDHGTSLGIEITFSTSPEDNHELKARGISRFWKDGTQGEPVLSIDAAKK